MKITRFNNFSSIRFIKSLYNANRPIGLYEKYPAAITPKKNLTSLLKNFLNKLGLK